MTFDPKVHLIQLPRRVKDQASGNGVTRQDDYLEVKWRLVWFRERYPHGSIITEELCVDLDRGYARFKAHVGDGEGGMAMGTAVEWAKSFADYVEKAETSAIGRALAALGRPKPNTCAISRQVTLQRSQLVSMTNRVAGSFDGFTLVEPKTFSLSWYCQQG